MRMSRLTTRSLAQLLAPALWVSLTAGCGGKQGEEDTSAGETPEVLDMTSCSAPDRYTFRPIGEFADGSVQGTFEDGNVTGFFVDADSDPNSYICPTRQTSTRFAAEIEGGRCRGTDYESNFAFRIQALNLAEWAVFGHNFANLAGQNEPIDATEWDGISFWAKRGCAPGDISPEAVAGRFCDTPPDNAPPADSTCASSPDSAGGDRVWTGRTIFASVTEWHTVAEGGFCHDSDIVEEKCDQFGVGVGIDEEWRLYTIPFAQMRQRGFGMPAECLYLRELWGLNFSLSPGNWDVWIDDFALYREGDEPAEREECTDAPPEE